MPHTSGALAMKHVLFFALIPVMVILVGCGSQEPMKAGSGRHALTTPAAKPGPAADSSSFISAAVEPQKAEENTRRAAEPPAGRKIVFTGTLELEVKEFSEARTRLDEFVTTAKGYFAKTDISGDSGTKRSGTFVVKVPVEHFHRLVDDLTTLGNPTKNHTDSQDVTDEFIDVTARVKTLKAEEEVLNKLLKDAAGRLEDVFKIREQIRSNRHEIEKSEGRLIALEKLSALSTLTVTLREIQAYVAPVVPVATPPSAPAFADRAGKTWGESFAALATVCQNVALVFVALAPWSPLLIVAGLGLWAARRYYVRNPATA